MAKVKFTISSAVSRFTTTSFLWVAALGIIIFLDWYFVARLDQSAALLSQSKSAIATLEEKRVSLLRERAELIKIEDKLARIDKIFTDSSEPLSFIEKLEKLARSRGLSLKLGLPQKREGALSMRIEVEGQFSGLAPFVKSVESFTEQTLFEDFSIERFSGKGKEARGRIVANIEVLAK